MNQYLPFLLLMLLITGLHSQNIAFTDPALKEYLVTQLCVDTDDDGIYETNADFNNDNEIQLTEAESIFDLSVGQYPDTFGIVSVTDLSYFKNLKRLTLLHHNSILEISNLGMDSLAYLWISSGPSIKHIDLSDLPNINELRIEGIMDMDYLNLQNGSFPSGMFSLFYSENIQYACVDNIPGEFNEVAYHMAPGVLPSVNCLVNVEESILSKPKVTLSILPNENTLFIDSALRLQQVELIDLQGRIRYEKDQGQQKIDISDLPAGIYVVRMQVAGKWIFDKFYK